MQRRYYIDYLRVFSCAAIVALHVIANRLDNIAPTETYYLSLSALMIFDRFAVPCFFMISGCNLLGRDQEFHLVKKHCLRMLIFVCIWGFLYEIADAVIYLIVNGTLDSSLLSFSNLFVGNASHLWFCFAIIGLYLFIPLINPLVKDKKRCEYFLGICLLSSIILPFLKTSPHVPSIFTMISHLLEFPDTGVYVFYFVLGYYLENHLELGRKSRLFIYTASILSFLTMIFYVFFNAIKYQLHTGISTPEHLTAIIFSMGVFVFFKYNFSQGKFYPLFRTLSKYSLGIYAMHNYLIVRLGLKGIHALMWSPFIAVPVVTFLVFFLCLSAGWVLKKIPLIGKWIV